MYQECNCRKFSLKLIFNIQDSGGFQMVSLLKLAEITEQGVKFQSPHDGQEMLLTPEKSTEIQNSIGADIIMQLDDVVSSTTTGDMYFYIISTKLYMDLFNW